MVRPGKNNRILIRYHYLPTNTSIRLQAGLGVIFNENKIAQWLGADTITFQKAKLAVQTMQTKYCTCSTPFSQSQPSTSKSSAEACPKPLSSSSKRTQDPLIAPLTICKDPHKAEQPNHYCQVLCLPGTVHSVPHNSNSLVSNYRLFRRPPSAPKITPLTQC